MLVQHVILTMTIALAAESALSQEVRQFDPLLLNQKGISITTGKSRINGIDQPLAVAFGSDAATLARRISEALKGEFTTNFVATDKAFILTISDMKSDQCASCTPPSSTNIDEIASKTYAFTFVPAADGAVFGLGSEAGALVAQAKSAIVYEGTIDQSALGDLRIASQSSMQIAQVSTNTLTGELDGPAFPFVSRLDAALTARGYVATTNERAAFRSTWVKDGSVVSLQTEPGNKAGSTQILLHEIVASP